MKVPVPNLCLEKSEWKWELWSLLMATALLASSLVSQIALKISAVFPSQNEFTRTIEKATLPWGRPWRASWREQLLHRKQKPKTAPGQRSSPSSQYLQCSLIFFTGKCWVYFLEKSSIPSSIYLQCSFLTGVVPRRRCCHSESRHFFLWASHQILMNTTWTYELIEKNVAQRR